MCVRFRSPRLPPHSFVMVKLPDSLTLVNWASSMFFKSFVYIHCLRLFNHPYYLTSGRERQRVKEEQLKSEHTTQAKTKAREKKM